MTAPELSVVIVSYRCADLLDECLASLDANRTDVAMEVEVVDNASGDGTADVARRHPWVITTELTENVGFARANNVGMDRARGRAVLVLNPDTVVPPCALRACLDELWRDPTVGLLTPRLADRDGRLDRRCHRGFPTLWSSFCYFTTLDRVFRGPRSRRYTLGHIPEDQATDVEAISGAFMLMPNAAMREVGGFDEQFFMYAEDIDLSLRFIEAGYRVRYWPGVTVVHVGAGSNVAGERPAAANAAYFRTMAPFVRKHRHGVRGALLALTVWVTGEVLLAATEARRRLGVRGR
jgi:N-acetylglucosaminyl-diphospho-decaprenol L-rhamnosyltransferase